SQPDHAIFGGRFLDHREIFAARIGDRALRSIPAEIDPHAPFRLHSADGDPAEKRGAFDRKPLDHLIEFADSDRASQRRKLSKAELEKVLPGIEIIEYHPARSFVDRNAALFDGRAIVAIDAAAFKQRKSERLLRLRFRLLAIRNHSVGEF